MNGSLIELIGNSRTAEKGDPEEAVQGMPGSGPLQRGEEARGRPLLQMVGKGWDREGSQHRDLELQPGIRNKRSLT